MSPEGSAKQADTVCAISGVGLYPKPAVTLCRFLLVTASCAVCLVLSVACALILLPASQRR